MDILGLMSLLPQFLCLNNCILYINLSDKIWWGTSGNKLSLCLDYSFLIICSFKYWSKICMS